MFADEISSPKFFSFMEMGIPCIFIANDPTPRQPRLAADFLEFLYEVPIAKDVQRPQDSLPVLPRREPARPLRGHLIVDERARVGPCAFIPDCSVESVSRAVNLEGITQEMSIHRGLSRLLDGPRMRIEGISTGHDHLIVLNVG